MPSIRRTADARRALLFATADRLLAVLYRWVEETGVVSSVDFVNAPTTQLWAAVEELNRRIAALARPEKDLLPRLDLKIAELKTRSLQARTDSGSAEAARALLAGCEEMFASVADPGELAGRKADCYRFASRLPPAALAPRTPVSLLNDAVAAAKSAGISAGPQLSELSDMLRVSGDYAGAFAAAQDALSAYESGGAQGSHGAMLALGRLTQITLRTDPKAALGYAREGFSRALAREDRGEQTRFKSDETRALLALNAAAAGLACARDAVDAARLEHNDGSELAAYGNLVRALRLARDLDEARERAKLGYSVAAALGDRVETGDFLVDLGTIAADSEQPSDALAFWRKAASALAGTGRVENEGALLANMERAAQQLDTPASHFECLDAFMALVDDFASQERRAICTRFVHHLKAALGKTSFEPAGDALRQLADAGAQVADMRGGGCEQLTFMRRAVDMSLDRASGKKKEALAKAAVLDGMSANGFELTAFVGA